MRLTPHPRHPRRVLYGELALLRGLGLDDPEILSTIAYDRAADLDLDRHWYLDDEQPFTDGLPRAVHSVLQRHDDGIYREIDTRHGTVRAAAWLGRHLRVETPVAALRERATAAGVAWWAVEHAVSDPRGALYGYVKSRQLPGRRGRPAAWSWGVDSGKIARRDRRSKKERIEEWKQTRRARRAAYAWQEARRERKRLDLLRRRRSVRENRRVMAAALGRVPPVDPSVDPFPNPPVHPRPAPITPHYHVEEGIVIRVPGTRGSRRSGLRGSNSPGSGGPPSCTRSTGDRCPGCSTVGDQRTPAERPRRYGRKGQRGPIATRRRGREPRFVAFGGPREDPAATCTLPPINGSVRLRRSGGSP